MQQSWKKNNKSFWSNFSRSGLMNLIDGSRKYTRRKTAYRSTMIHNAPYHKSSTSFTNYGILFRVGLTAVGVPVLVALLWLYFGIFRDLPNIAEIEKYSFSQATVITDKNGEPLYKLFDEHREYISYEQISPYFVNALIATEDQRFWTNPGVDRKGTLRALITDITQGKTQG